MPTSQVVGAQGGEVTTSGGELAVTIPAGALAQNVMITVEGAEAPATGNVGTVYEIGPTGTQFAMPVTLTLHYSAADLGGATESSLRVATFANGSWQLLAGAVVDTQAKTVSGITTHLSPYTIVTESAGRTCATVFGGAMCSSPDATAGGSGSLTPTCTPSTCAATTDTCQAYPGSTRDSCTDGANGYSATCCFAQDAPICFAVGAGASCSGPASTGGAVTCPDIPRCATATNACAAYPGATLQGCTDNSNGYTGGCCFAPQAPVCVAVSAGRTCSGSTSGGTTCAPAPRCADANPCSQYAGGTVQSCTDTDSGYTATCCFAAGTLPMSSGPVSGADGTPTGMTGGSGGAGATGGTGTIDPGATGGRSGTGGAGGITTGGTSGGVGATSGGGAGGNIGTGGATDPGTCGPDLACQPGQHCGSKTADSCLDCTCGADGRLVCQSCLPGTGGTPGTGGISGAGATSGGGTTGGTGATAGGTGGAGGTVDACTPGATCGPGQLCGAKTADGSCVECGCDSTGHLVCNPCGSTGSGGVSGGGGGTTGTGNTTGAGATTGGGGPTSTCGPGATCSAGQICNFKTADGSCMQCDCDPNGQYVCNPCPGTGTGGTSGGTTGTGGATGGSGTCALMTMPPQNGAPPCGVTELCPDGSSYAVKCDGVNPCICSSSQGQTPAAGLSCANFDPLQALSACGFPPGKI